MVLEISKEELSSYIKELIAWDAFEIQMMDCDGRKDLLIPYVMNDAVECFFRLQDGEMIKQEVEDEIFITPKRFGHESILVDGKRFIFRAVKLECHPYQYHRIGHNWRKEKGEEHIRRLVNLLCVLHDKASYLGELGCNELEMSLYQLIEFRPLCYFTPINESIESWYPETDEGIDAMSMLAREAGDAIYVQMIENYRSVPIDDNRKNWEVINMANALLEPEHEKIFWLLDEKIIEASCYWKERRYAPVLESSHNDLRKKKEEAYRMQGFKGQYPFMSNDDTGKQILFVEEHPFTIMETEEYRFKIFEIDCLPMNKI